MTSRLLPLLLLCGALIAFGGQARYALADDGGDSHGENESGESHDGADHSDDGGSHDREERSDNSGSGGSRDGSGREHGSSSSERSHGSEGRTGSTSGRGRTAAHDSARVAVTSGAVVPYKDVLKRLEKRGAGRVLQVQLTIGSVRSIYELKVEDKQGNISTVTVDAGTGSILSGGR